MKQSSLYLIVLTATILFASCRKERKELQWSTDWSAPLAHGSFGVEDITGDTLLMTETDSSLSLHLDTDIFTFDINELAGIDDLFFQDTFALPFSIPVDIPQGQEFVNQPELTVLDLDGAEITDIYIKSAQIAYQLKSTIAGEVIYTYSIPKALDENGIPFSREIVVPASSGTNPAVITGTFNLGAYHFDLSGVNGNSFNEIETVIACEVSAQNAAAVNVSSLDTLIIQNEIKDFEITGAIGYFGSLDYSTGPMLEDIDAFNGITNGNFNLRDAEVLISIVNGAGIDGSIKINEFAGVKNNADLSMAHSLIGQNHTLNRAVKQGDVITPHITSFDLNSGNSNIVALLEYLPDALKYDMDFELNPLGNMSGYNDFYFTREPIRIRMEADIPLAWNINNLTFVDTLDLLLQDSSVLNHAKLDLEVLNGFPIDMEIDLALLDQNNAVAEHIVIPGEIPSGSLDVNDSVIAPTRSNHEIELTSRELYLLRNIGKVKLSVYFNTPDGSSFPNLYQHYQFDYNLTGDFQVHAGL